MFKEVIISIVIIVFIISLDIITQNYTRESVIQTSLELANLKDEIKTKKVVKLTIFNYFNIYCFLC